MSFLPKDLYRRQSSACREPLVQCATRVGFAAFALLLGSCNGSPDASGGLNVAKTGDSGANGNTILSRAKIIHCESGHDCSPAIGVLTSKEGDDFTQCAATLIEDDVAMTASHCIPDDLKNSDGSCSGRIWVHFGAAGGFADATADCKEVISASALSDRTRAQPDIAFIRLSTPLDRPPYKVSHEGFDPNGHYSAIKLENNGTDTALKISQTACHPVFGSEVLPGSTRSTSSVIALGDCLVSNLSAGAPVLDEDGEIRGILDLPVPQSRILRKIDSRKLLESTIPSFTLATNFACVRLPEYDEDYVLPSNCQDNPNDRSDADYNDLNQRLLSEFSSDPAVRASLRPVTPTIEWEPKAFLRDSAEGRKIARAISAPGSLSMFSLPMPSCVSEKQKNTTFNLRLPVLGFMFALDRYLTLQLDHAERVGTVLAHMEIELTRLSDDEIYRVLSVFFQLPGTGTGNEALYIRRAEIPLCQAP